MLQCSCRDVSTTHVHLVGSHGLSKPRASAGSSHPWESLVVSLLAGVNGCSRGWVAGSRERHRYRRYCCVIGAREVRNGSPSTRLESRHTSCDDEAATSSQLRLDDSSPVRKHSRTFAAVHERDVRNAPDDPGMLKPTSTRVVSTARGRDSNSTWRVSWSGRRDSNPRPSPWQNGGVRRSGSARFPEVRFRPPCFQHVDCVRL